MKKLKLINDQALLEGTTVKEDGLDFKIYSSVLTNVAMNTDGPYTIGIFGKWGTGKTSLLRLVEKNIEEQSDYIIIWFNAWQYEQDMHPIIPLVETIINALKKKNKLTEKLSIALKSLVYAFSFSAKAGIPNVVGFEASFDPSKMQDKIKELSSEDSLGPSLFTEVFNKLSALNEIDTKIIVFVDDLDRCFPDNAIKLLESIKLILNQDKFIFFLSASREVIEGYLIHKYQVEYGLTNFDGVSYLDKIIQLPFYIPPHEERINKFSKSILKLIDTEDKSIIKDILPIIGFACAYNPRTIIRFINNLIIDTEIYNQIKNKQSKYLPIGYFAINRSLQYQWVDIFNFLRNSDKLCKKIAVWALDKFSDSADHIFEPKLIYDRINQDDKLRSLLSSKPGMAWLYNSELRKASINFTLTSRPQILPKDDPLYSGDIMMAVNEYNNTTSHKIIEIFKKNNLELYTISAHGLYQPATEGIIIKTWILFLDENSNNESNFSLFYDYINGTCGQYQDLFVIIEKSKISKEYEQFIIDIKKYNLEIFNYPNDIQLLCDQLKKKN